MPWTSGPGAPWPAVVLDICIAGPYTLHPSHAHTKCTHRKLQATIDKLDSKKAQATVPADADMIKGKIVKTFGGHKQFDLKLREALNVAVEGYTSHVELAATCKALGAGRTSSSKNKDALKEFVQALSRAGKRLLPPDPIINLKCTHLDLSETPCDATFSCCNGLVQLLQRDAVGSLTSLDFGWIKLGDEDSTALAAVLKETNISNLKCAAAPA